MTETRPVTLCILDGWGLSDDEEGNAPRLARTPNMDRLMETCPNATLITHGPDVGLPPGQMGNSEVGHTNIGAGRVVPMDLGRIDQAVADGTYAGNGALRGFVRRLRESGGRAHLFGVISDGGVHGHIDHVSATARIVADAGVPVVIHAVTDGRDTAPRSAGKHMRGLLAALPEGARVGTVIGRYFAMDRDNRWDRVRDAWEAIALGRGSRSSENPAAAVDEALARGESDEFIRPTTIGGYAGLAPEDGMFCLNFRADRARQIMSALVDPAFDGFDATAARPGPRAVLGMVGYSDRLSELMDAVFPKAVIRNTLAAWVSAKGLRQFHCAETEKYPHVTFFLNGGNEAPEPGEDRHMPRSPDVATYDLAPEMSAAEVAGAVAGAIRDRYDLIVVNFANPDMVGHTGDLAAAVAACEAVDAGLGKLLEALEGVGGRMVVCADHGNCETMIDPETGGAHTAHTLNPVPVVVVGSSAARVEAGRLADLAPTVLELMGLDAPREMTGRSLLA